MISKYIVTSEDIAVSDRFQGNIEACFKLMSSNNDFKWQNKHPGNNLEQRKHPLINADRIFHTAHRLRWMPKAQLSPQNVCTSVGPIVEFSKPTQAGAEE